MIVNIFVDLAYQGCVGCASCSGLKTYTGCPITGTGSLVGRACADGAPEGASERSKGLIGVASVTRDMVAATI